MVTERFKVFIAIRLPLQVSQKWGNAVAPCRKVRGRRSVAFPLNLSTAQTCIEDLDLFYVITLLAAVQRIYVTSRHVNLVVHQVRN